MCNTLFLQRRNWRAAHLVTTMSYIAMTLKCDHKLLIAILATHVLLAAGSFRALLFTRAATRMSTVILRYGGFFLPPRS